jgi:hypothetical protein
MQDRRKHMTGNFTLGIALAMVGSTAVTAQAALMNGTHAGKGTVIDTVNQTEWLDVDQTTGLSPHAAVMYNPDYRWATIADLQAMLDQFFAAYPPTPTTYVLVDDSQDVEVITYTQTGAFTDLFGFHANDPGLTDSFFDDESDDGNQDAFQLNDSSATPIIASWYIDLNGTPDGDLATPFRGVWLVRDIPEPASAALLALGGVALLRRRSRQTLRPRR